MSDTTGDDPGKGARRNAAAPRQHPATPEVCRYRCSQCHSWHAMERPTGARVPRDRGRRPRIFWAARTNERLWEKRAASGQRGLASGGCDTRYLIAQAKDAPGVAVENLLLLRFRQSDLVEQPERGRGIPAGIVGP